MSLLIAHDGDKLSGQAATPFWTAAPEFTVLAWVKITAAGWGEIFGIYDYANIAYNNATLRTAAGTAFDHNLVIKGNDKRMDGSGAVSGAWQMVALVYKQGVSKIAYLNNSAARTDLTNVPEQWEWGVGADGIVFGGNVGRMKIAHGAVWNVALSAAEIASLYNGGAGGAGKNPSAVQAAALKFYRPMTSDATGGVGTITLNTTGSPAFDGADNPNVEAAGGGSGASTAVAATTANATGGLSASVTIPSGTFTSEVLKDGAGVVQANKALNFVCLYNDTTGALVVRKTGLSTNASGIFSFSDAALTPGVFYRPDWETVDGLRRMPRKAAT